MSTYTGRDGTDRRGTEIYTPPPEIKLNPKERKCVEMARNNYSNAEIDSILNLTYNATNYILRKAKTKGAEFPNGKNKIQLKTRQVKPKVGVVRWERNQAVIKLLDAGEKHINVIFNKLKTAHPTLTKGMVSGIVYRYNLKKEGVDPNARTAAKKRLANLNGN